MGLIYSLCDYTGNWAKPWKDAGHEVVLVDIKHGTDVLTLKHPGRPVHAVFAAPPCTDFTVSGAQYWPAKDTDGRTQFSLSIVRACLAFKDACRPSLKLWSLENPIGRLPKFIGPYRMIFNPCDYGGYLPSSHVSTNPLIPDRDAYTKKTCLWGDFNIPEKRPVPPVRSCKQGSWIQKLGGKSERTKELRSETPMGFAIAFYEANKHRLQDI